MDFNTYVLVFLPAVFFLSCRPVTAGSDFLSSSSLINDEKREWSAEPGVSLVPALPLRGNMDQSPLNRQFRCCLSADAAYKSAAKSLCASLTHRHVQQTARSPHITLTAHLRLPPVIEGVPAASGLPSPAGCTDDQTVLRSVVSFISIIAYFCEKSK